MQINFTNSETLTGRRKAGLAKNLLGSWNQFKVNLFKEFKASSGEEKLGKSLDAYYEKIYELKPDIAQTVPDFLTLPREEKRKALWTRVFTTNRQDPIYTAAFGALNPSQQEDLLKGLAYHIGSQEMRNWKPCLPIETKVDEFVREKIRKEFKVPKGIEFASSGSSAVVFAVNHKTNPYMLKLSIQRDTDDPKRIHRLGFKHEAIERDMEVLGKEHRQYAQQLAKTRRVGWSLSSINKTTQDGALATNYLPGVALDATVTPEELEGYVKEKVELKSLIGFIEAIFKLGKGSDISALAHTNVVYDSKQKSLSLINCAGPDNEEYNDRRKIIKENSLRFVLHKLVSDVVLLQASTAENLRGKISEALAKTGSNIEKFMQEQFELLTKALREIFDKKISGFTKKEAITELTNLENIANSDEKYKKLFGANLGLSDGGLAYITKLKQELAK